MKKFVKGVRFAPKNYSDEVEAKIQPVSYTHLTLRRAI